MSSNFSLVQQDGLLTESLQLRVLQLVVILLTMASSTVLCVWSLVTACRTRSLNNTALPLLLALQLNNVFTLSSSLIGASKTLLTSTCSDEPVACWTQGFFFNAGPYVSMLLIAAIAVYSCTSAKWPNAAQSMFTGLRMGLFSVLLFMLPRITTAIQIGSGQLQFTCHKEMLLCEASHQYSPWSPFNSFGIISLTFLLIFASALIITLIVGVCKKNGSVYIKPLRKQPIRKTSIVLPSRSYLVALMLLGSLYFSCWLLYDTIRSKAFLSSNMGTVISRIALLGSLISVSLLTFLLYEIVAPGFFKSFVSIRNTDKTSRNLAADTSKNITIEEGTLQVSRPWQKNTETDAPVVLEAIEKELTRKNTAGVHCSDSIKRQVCEVVCQESCITKGSHSTSGFSSQAECDVSLESDGHIENMYENVDMFDGLEMESTTDTCKQIDFIPIKPQEETSSGNPSTMDYFPSDEDVVKSDDENVTQTHPQAYENPAFVQVVDPDEDEFIEFQEISNIYKHELTFPEDEC